MGTKKAIVVVLAVPLALALFLLTSWIGLKFLIWALRLAGADL